MIPLRSQKTASYKHQTVFSCHMKALGIFLNANLILVIFGLTFLRLNQKLIRENNIEARPSPAPERTTRIYKI